MQFDNQKEFFESLQKSSRILIALPQNPNIDVLGSGLGLAAFLKKAGKQVDLICERLNSKELDFLPGISEVGSAGHLSNAFVISLSTERAKIDEISYQKRDGAVDINIKPKQGNFSAADVSFKNGSGNYDWAVCIGTASFEDLGSIYTNNAELFFSTPKINIDNHIGNENYANINIVDITAASTGEIIFELVKNFDSKILDREIATCLLASIIGATNSFQLPSTTPNSLLRASELVSLGADQKEIVRHLFKTRDFSMLKLLGRAMARIHSVPEYGAVYAVVNRQDLERSEAGQGQIIKAIQELQKNISDFKILFFAVENNGGIDLYIVANPNIKLSEIVHYFGGEFITASLGRAVLNNRRITDIETVIGGVLSELRPRLGL